MLSRARNDLMFQRDRRLILLGHPYLKVCLASIDAFRISSTISQHSFGYPRKITFSRIFFLIFLDFSMFRLHYLSSISQRLSSGTSFPSLNEYFVVLLAAFVKKAHKIVLMIFERRKLVFVFLSNFLSGGNFLQKACHS